MWERNYWPSNRPHVLARSWIRSVFWQHQPLLLYIADLACVLSLEREKVVSEASPRGAEGEEGECFVWDECFRSGKWFHFRPQWQTLFPMGGFLGIFELSFTIEPISTLRRSRLVLWMRRFSALWSNFRFPVSFLSFVYISHLERGFCTLLRFVIYVAYHVVTSFHAQAAEDIILCLKQNLFDGWLYLCWASKSCQFAEDLLVASPCLFLLLLFFSSCLLQKL